MPDESIVVTLLRSSRMFVLPAFTALVITSRSCVSPAPMVIFPSRAMISTPPTVRELAFMLTLLFSNSCFRAGDSASFGQVLRHHQRRPAAGKKRVMNLVHEGLHVEDAAAARFHEVLRFERIPAFLRVE